MMMSHGEMLLRIGVERPSVESSDTSAIGTGVPCGLRTHLIVAMAVATFMVISSQFVYWQHYGKDDLVEVDTERIAASVVSAVGFLAGGAILRRGSPSRASRPPPACWLVTAIGMCAGAGMFVESAAVTLMGIVALTVLRRFEDKDDHLLLRRVSVVLGEHAQDITAVVESLKKLGAKVSDVEYEKRLDDEKKHIVRDPRRAVRGHDWYPAAHRGDSSGLWRPTSRRWHCI